MPVSRQRFLSGVGLGGVAVAIAACSTSDEPAAADTESEPGSAAGVPAVLAATAEVPVGSGIIVEGTVLTQPTAGEFKAFSTVCPHAGCQVNQVSGAAIICPCHNSRFNLDGSVAGGPATQPLEPKSIAVEGDSILNS
jgi:Rieske Fe-S protein